jgi:uncharacterized repeat protein (TIGR01451 family)
MHHRTIAIAGVLACVGVCPALADSQPVVRAAAAPEATLSIQTTANRRTVPRGGTIAFKIKVTNDSQTAASEVTICDQLPRTVSRLIRSGGLRLFDDLACRTRSTLAAGESVVVRLLARIGADAQLGCDHNKARVIWSGHRAHASVSYRVTASRA